MRHPRAPVHPAGRRAVATTTCIARGGTRERLEALSRWYAAAGIEVVEQGVWGAPFGTGGGQGWETFDDGRLRNEMVGMGAAVGERRIVTAPSGPTALYSAGDGVFATHAVAAAWLAFGGVTIDEAALPELLAYDFVGGSRTLIAGVSPVPAATVIEDGRSRSWWPASERWAAIDERDAYAHAERALLETLGARVGDDAVLMLTAGADSRVLALALAELGRPFSALLWGGEASAELPGARAVADHVGVELRQEVRWREDDELAPAFDSETRWSDGVLALSVAERVWPQTAAVVFGAAGEVGRAFYHRAGGRSQLDALAPEARLPGAPDDVQRELRSTVRGWLDEAEHVAQGWRALDVLYAEQRVARWGRGQIPQLDAAFVAGFSPVEVQRGLSSLPLVARRTDGFHRRFVAERAPALALPEPPAPPRERPRWRPRRRPRPAAPAAPDAFLQALWAERPQTRDWICEQALAPGSPVGRALGEAWCARTREAFLRGEPRPTEQALLAAGPAALERALRDLR